MMQILLLLLRRGLGRTAVNVMRQFLGQSEG